MASKGDKPKEAAFEDGGNAQQTTESFSAQPMKSTVPTDIVYRTLDGINEELTSNSILQGGIHVTLKNGKFAYCYLATTDMNMHYMFKPPIVDGNHSLQWIARPDSKGEGGKIFSNVVTDEANVKVNDNPQAFLSIGTVLTKSEQSRYTVVEGPPDYVFHLEADQKDKTKIAIYTKYDTRYYLEPNDDDTHKIIAVPEDKRKYTYPFKFPA